MLTLAARCVAGDTEGLSRCPNDLKVRSRPAERILVPATLSVRPESLPFDASAPMSSPAKPPRILLVDDEPIQTSGLARAFRGEPWELDTAQSAEEALRLFSRSPYDVVVTDETMPGLRGSELLAQLRETTPDTVRIVLSGQADLGAAVNAINAAEVFRFLQKPCSFSEVSAAIRDGLELRAQQAEFHAWRGARNPADAAQRGAEFDEALASLWMGYQPVLRAADESLYGYEALVRTDSEVLVHPGLLFSAAERLGRSAELSRCIRDRVARDISAAPAEAAILVNVTADDLADSAFVNGEDPLRAHSERIVLEVTERHSFKEDTHLQQRVASLRRHGYRIAVDDLGSGYSGLTSFMLVSPDVVKFDMELTRGIDTSPTQQRLIELMTGLCRQLGILTVAEGIETEAELETVTRLGCDLLQGFLFGAAARDFALPGSRRVA